MKPFLTIATPHKDVLQGTPTFDVFAADLWEVFQKRASPEYQDSDIFFQKTYLTAGLKNLLDAAEKRLKGKGGDSVIQLLTPFGGGKTHSLIALYHKAKEWKVNVVVLDGTAFDPKEVILWEEIERQLTGKIEKLKGLSSPGKEKLRNLLVNHSPLLILMDEILEYTTKASAIKVGNSTLSSQVLSFVQELTQTVSTIENSLLIVTLPSSFLEHYGEESERLFQQLHKITGRMEKIYEPVTDEEIALVIKKRLFSQIDEKKAKSNIEEFLNYAERENILPESMEKSVYRERFIKSYPFQPEVIDVLYQRWGSFPGFQRTRGVLRLLSLVVYSLRNSKIPFIRLSDFDLLNSEIKAEFIKQIGPEYNSVISADITSPNSSAKKVDKELGDAYLSFSFGTKSATTIFMYSFSGGPEKGASLKEIKLSTAEVDVPSSIIAEAVSKLKDTSLYLQYYEEKYFFTNQPNLNKLVLDKMENIEEELIKSEEKNLLDKRLKKDFFIPFIWPKNSKDIPDTKEFKLIIMDSMNKDKCKEFLENYGKQPRVYQNTLIFLCPMDEDRVLFEKTLKEKIAWEMIEKEGMENLNDQQKKEVKENIKKKIEEEIERLRNFYRIVLLPCKDGFKEIDLGISTYGKEIILDVEVYDRLKNEGEILEKIAPLILKERYLKNKEYVETKNILESFYKAPGELRIKSDDVLKDSIKEGVKQGLFGLGEIENQSPICRCFKEEGSPELCEGEILISEKLSKKEGIEEILQPSQSGIKEKTSVLEIETGKQHTNIFTDIFLKVNVPSGKLSDVARIISYLSTLFNNIEIKIELSAKEGKIKISDYEDKIKEALSQSNIEIEEEKLR